MSVFNQLPTTRKGAIAEQYVAELLTSTKQWHVYRVSHDSAHPVDMMAITEDGVIAVEVKCKTARVYYPDTGVDYNDHYHYCSLAERMSIPILLLFVDPTAARVYGNYLHNLSMPTVIYHNGMELVYPLVDGAKRYVYYPLELMIDYGSVPPAIVSQLQKYTNSRYSQPLPPRVGVDKTETDGVYYNCSWLVPPANTDEESTS